jgi:opacity protein-like surface antigen
MKIHALAIALAAACALPAYAQGLYAGIDVGRSRVSDSGIKWTATGVAVYGGYGFTPNFAVELGYRNLGSSSVLGVGVKANSTQLSLVGTLPLSPQFGLYGRLGMNSLYAKAAAAGVSASDRETKALVGVGLRWAMNKQFALRLELQKPDSDTNTTAFGAEFKF